MSSEETLVTDEGFKEEILSKLNQLRKEGILCDVTLRIEGQDFAAHRCVLSAASPYFRALFTSELAVETAENNSYLIELKEFKSAAAAAEVLRFIYTGEALVDSTNAQDLFRAADYLIIETLKTKVAIFLKDKIDATNCLLLESFGVHFNCKSLEKAAIACQLQNFATVVKSEDFETLDFEKVRELISHDEIIVSNEEEVFEAVISWVKHDILAREHLLPELLKCVRLFSMSKDSLLEILETEELVTKNSACANILHKGMDFLLFPDHYEGMLLNPRDCQDLTKYEHAVVLTGGIGDDLESKQTYAFSLSTNKWLTLSEMPYSSSGHGAAVCGGQLYVFSGQSSHPVSVSSFSPKQNKWSCVTNVWHASRNYCSVTTYQEELYVIGGEEFWCSVVKFNPKHDKWTYLRYMTTRRAAHCAVAMVNGICVIGGHDDDQCHRSVEFYDPVTNQWSEMPPLVNGRKFAAAAISGEKIIVVGGYDIDFEIEANCEIFDPAVDQWSLVSSPVVPRAACGIISFDNHVYVFGGERANLDGHSIYEDSVECYDIQSDTWQRFGAMPASLSCLQASLVLLPKKLFNDEEGGADSSGDDDDDDDDDDDGDDNIDE